MQLLLSLVLLMTSLVLGDGVLTPAQSGARTALHPDNTLSFTTDPTLCILMRRQSSEWHGAVVEESTCALLQSWAQGQAANKKRLARPL